MKWLAVCALLICGVVLADSQTDAEARRLQAQLTLLQQEQQTVYQQFQMIQELRRTEIELQYPQVIQNSPDYAMGNSPPNYEDVVRQKAERETRIKQYTDDLTRLYARYREIDGEKKALLERLNQLTPVR